MMTPELQKKLLYNMLRIRLVEERIDNEYLDDQMRTPVHLYIGQEAIACGVSEVLNPDDYIQTNHRSHGHYLAKGGDLKKLIAELFCKSTGCSGAFGGSMHLYDKNIGLTGSSAIVAGGISIGTGMGLSILLQNQKKVSVVYMGDGASESGVYYESISFAILKKLPVIYILENNKLSVCSHISKRQVCDNVFINGVDKDKLFTAQIDGNDPEIVYKTSKEAIEHARLGRGPALIECYTYRVSGHAGCKKQDAVGYRDQQEEQDWHNKCPIKTYKNKLLTQNIITQNYFESITNEISQEIKQAFAFAMESPLPRGDLSSEIHKYLYSE